MKLTDVPLNLRALTFRAGLLAVTLSVGCGDDSTSADGGETEAATSTSSTSGTSSTAATSTTTSTSGSTTDDPTTTEEGSSGGSAGSTGSSSGSSSDGTSTGSGSSGTGSSSGTAGSTGTTEGTGTTTGGTNEVCEEGGELVLNWGIQVIDGVYPDDIPTEMDEACVLGAAMPGQMRVDCPSVDFFVNIESTPVIDLPDNGTALQARVHWAPGPLGFPDFWVQFDFANGLNLALAASSVLEPTTMVLDLPWEMTLSEDECGPYTLMTPFGKEDPCGDQMWLGLDLTVDDQTFTVFHGSYGEIETMNSSVQAWVGAARDYGTLPQFCDFAPAFFTTMTAELP